MPRIVYSPNEEIPEGLKDRIVEKDGERVVESLPDAWAIEDVGGMRGSLALERAARKRAQAIAGEFGWRMDEATGTWREEGMSAVEARKAVEMLKTGGLKGKDEIENYRKALADDFEGKSRAKDAELAELTRELESILVERVGLEALSAAQAINPKIMLPSLRSMAKVEKGADGRRTVVCYDETGKPILSKKAGANGAAAPIEEVVEGWRGSPDYQGFFKAPAAGGSGSGSQAGGSGRPAGNQDTSNMSPAELIALGNASAT